jgi:hypothetical protein
LPEENEGSGFELSPLRPAWSSELATQTTRPILTAWPHRLGRYYDPECLRANPVMKRRIHDADFAVRGHVDPWGPGLHPYFVHLERV